MPQQKSAIVFLALGIAFVAIGAAAQQVFLWLGAAFLMVAMVILVRHLVEQQRRTR